MLEIYHTNFVFSKMLRRGAGQVTRGYVSFIERNSVGLVNIDSKLIKNRQWPLILDIAQNSGSVDELIKIQRQLEYWIDEPNRIRVICFEGCDAIFKQLRETKDTVILTVFWVETRRNLFSGPRWNDGLHDESFDANNNGIIDANSRPVRKNLYTKAYFYKSHSSGTVSY